MAPPTRILIFDLDGTLVDSMGPAVDLFCEMLEQEYGLANEVSRPIFTRLMGKGPKAQFTAVLQQVGALEDEVIDDLTRRYWLRAEEDVPDLFPEVVEVLEGLHRNGHTLIVSSGGIPSSVKRRTNVTGIERFFRLVLGSDENVPSLAKGPGHFSLIAEALSLCPGELEARGVFIGDGVYDMEVASRAGISGVGRLTGSNAATLLAAGARRVIQDLRELAPLLDSL